MSKIFTSNHSGECLPWQAPNFEAIEDSEFRYQPSASSNLRTPMQHQLLQQQIYEKGFEQGRKDGLLQGQKEIQEQVEYLQSLMATLAMPLLDLDKQVVNELVELSMSVVKQMVRRELKISPGEVVAVVKEAISLLPVTAGDVNLELHPEDAELVRKALFDNDSEPQWKIVESPVLTRGGCRVVTNTTRIDATVENRINAVIAAVMGGERKVDIEGNESE